MKKQTTVEVLLEKCPSCGAPRVGQEAACHYCGCSMVQTKRIIEEVEDTPVAPNVQKDDRRVDIISEVEPKEPGALGNVAGIAFMIVWCTAAFGMGFFAISMGAGPIFGIVPFGMGAVGVIILITTLLKPASEYKRVMTQGHEYPAVVLGYGRKPITFTSGESHTIHSIMRLQVKVLADIDGRETCILLNAPSSVSELSHPIGCKVTIIGYENKFLLR